MPLKFRLLALPLAASALLAVACGGDDDDDPTATNVVPTTASVSQTTATEGSATSGATRAPASGLDAEYIEAVCGAGAGFVEEFGAATNEYAQAVAGSEDAEVIGAALQEHFAPVFGAFLEDMQAIEAPGDVADYHSRIVGQLDEVTTKLNNADPTALESILTQQLDPPPADVAERLNAIAQENPECAEAGFFIADSAPPAASPTP